MLVVVVFVVAVVVVVVFAAFVDHQMKRFPWLVKLLIYFFTTGIGLKTLFLPSFLFIFFLLLDEASRLMSFCEVPSKSSLDFCVFLTFFLSMLFLIKPVRLTFLWLAKFFVQIFFGISFALFLKGFWKLWDLVVFAQAFLGIGFLNKQNKCVSSKPDIEKDKRRKKQASKNIVHPLLTVVCTKKKKGRKQKVDGKQQQQIVLRITKISSDD